MRNSVDLLAVLTVLIAGAASPAVSAEDSGKVLLEGRCGRCHAVSAGVKSPLGNAPNLWDILRFYPPDQLEFELAEGMGSKHREMPQIQFTSEEIASVQNYLASE
ncbi:cytochrome c [Hyphomicrobium sp.]|uniref:c-type cytochrome n=1 Tax=Hyphomicrobium sp. TaxID=82 RepID=UPI002E30D30B|nr:cytochrome c [Hyphomicrobium sp.]HEX2842089.1 cytochrome c [Hyphomicrobium sp.]